MLSLLQKIDANAKERLVVPPGTPPSVELPRYRQFLKVEAHRLKMQHRAGDSGRTVCQARCLVMDLLIQHLWEAGKNTLSDQARKEFPSMALVALGGYGRGELNPHSDVDIMFLHSGQVVAAGTPLPCLSKLMNGIMYPLWDLGYKVGHSVRNTAECVQIANSDMQAKTSLLEARLVVGDEKLFQKLEKLVWSKCVAGHEDDYISARLQDQAARHAKFGNSATMQEPNIKNGCGGLRDYQNLHWMAMVKYGTRGLPEMETRGLITSAERKQLEAAYDFLMKVRDELHYQTSRPVDVLSRSLQPTVAHYLGYTDRSPARRLEEFMRDLYAHSRNIYLTTRMLEDRLALQPRNKPLSALKQLISAPFRQARGEQTLDGFKITAEQIQHAHPRVFREQPRRLMRVFLYAQQRGLKLHPDLAQLIRQQISVVDRGFLRDEHVRETFLSILNQRGSVVRVLRAMHDVGLLGKYLPEFGKLTCLVQHEFYHQYAADEHTLMCLEEVDRLMGADTAPTKKYADLLHALERPFILYLVLLLHDAGKALHTGNHTEVGTQLALRVARRLGLDGATSQCLQLLVEQHLEMAIISQRRDLEDLSVIRAFAGQIQSVENLRMLTLLTLADSRATSNKLWTEFKDTLLWQLYSKTYRMLTGGPDFRVAEARQRELLREEVEGLLPRTITEEELQAHFDNLPSRYFQIHDAREMVVDVGLAHRFMYQQLALEEKALEPVTEWTPEPDRGYTRFKVCTWDRAGLFDKMAGSLAATGVNILSAQAFTRNDGIVIDTFLVVDARTGQLVGKEQREQTEHLLQQVLTGHKVDFWPMIAKLNRAGRPSFQRLEGERLPTRIQFDNKSSVTHTIIEIETEDRLGLLFMIAEAFVELELDISVAKITTEKGAAIDSFYVAEENGEKLTNSRHEAVEKRLRQAITELDGVLSKK